jgi:hypothetical protein
VKSQGDDGVASHVLPPAAAGTLTALPSKQLTCAGPAARAEINQPAATPSAELTPAMIAPPTVTAKNERPKLVLNAPARNTASESSSTATTTTATTIAGWLVADQ